jgi:hypothetical protein
MDNNSSLMKMTRDESLSWGEIGNAYHQMGELSHYIAGLQAVLASAAAKQAQNIIKTEFGVDIDEISVEDFAIDTEEYDDDDDDPPTE